MLNKATSVVPPVYLYPRLDDGIQTLPQMGTKRVGSTARRTYKAL